MYARLPNKKGETRYVQVMRKEQVWSGSKNG